MRENQIEITVAGATITVVVEGNIISDHQMLYILRAAGIIPAKDKGRYSIGVSFGHEASLCYTPRTPSGKVSAKIQDCGKIMVPGYEYRGHSISWLYDGEHGAGQMTYSWIRL